MFCSVVFASIAAVRSLPDPDFKSSFVSLIFGFVFPVFVWPVEPLPLSLLAP
jgi:hypothetical protein